MAGPVPTRPAGGCLRLSAGLLCVWLFMFVVAPWVRTLGPVEEVLDFVESRDIDAGALFYTEVDEFADAEVAVRDALAY